MQINLMLNGVRVSDDVAPDTLLIDFVRRHGCLSVKRGCETSNCGLCTVFLDDKPVLSCSVLAARADGHKVTTLEGLQEEAAEFGAFIADQGAELTWDEVDGIYTGYVTFYGNKFTISTALASTYDGWDEIKDKRIGAVAPTVDVEPHRRSKEGRGV